jgi:hypothetical protein
MTSITEFHGRNVEISMKGKTHFAKCLYVGKGIDTGTPLLRVREFVYVGCEGGAGGCNLEFMLADPVTVKAEHCKITEKTFKLA